MIIGAGPNPKPQDYLLDMGSTSFIPKQRTHEFNRRPLHPAVRYLPFFDSLFRVMGQIEKDMALYELLPQIERVTVHGAGIVPGTNDVDEVFKSNKFEVRMYFQEITRRIGGLPVKLATFEGTAIQGNITDVHNLIDGKWAFSLSPHSDAPPTIYHSADEVRTGYRAAILGEGDLSEVTLD